jgi:glucose-6-phosphate isomerase
MKIDFSLVTKHYAARTHEKMTDVMMDADGNGPAIHYYMIRGGVKQKNITVWEPGTISGEYIKTYGHYHIGKLDETYWILFGEGIALLQKLLTDKNGIMIADKVAEFKAIKVKSGDKVYMPPGFGHLIANTGKTYLVTADDSPVNFNENNPVSLPGHADYEMVKIMHGFAYYVIEKKGRPVLKKNPYYTKIEKTDFGGFEITD